MRRSLSVSQNTVTITSPADFTTFSSLAIVAQGGSTGATRSCSQGPSEEAVSRPESKNRVSKSSEEVQNITRRLRTNLPLFWIWHLGIRLQEHTEHIDMPKENCFGGCIIYLHFSSEVSDRH